MAFVNVYVLRSDGADSLILKYNGTTWDTIDTGHSSGSQYMWPYLGAGRFIHAIDEAVNQYSSDYADNWAAATGPGAPYDGLTHFAITPGGSRVWGIWVDAADGDNSAICYSDDWGATWTLSRANPAPGGIGARPLCAIACHPTDPNKIVAINRTSLNKIRAQYTTDGGSSWSQSSDVGYVGIFAAANTATICWAPNDNWIIHLTATIENIAGYMPSPYTGFNYTASYAAANVRQMIPAGNDGTYFCLFDALDAGAPLKRSPDFGASWEDMAMPSGWSSFSYDDGSIDYDSEHDRLWIGRQTKIFYLSPTATGASWTEVTDYGGLAASGAHFKGIVVTEDEASGDGDDDSATPPEGHTAGGWRHVSPPLKRLVAQSPPRSMVAAPDRRPMR